MSQPIVIQSSSAKRLMRDYKDLLSEPISFISAVPTEKNVHLWHCNIFANRSPYTGTVFHIKMKFPSDYPHKPPRVQLCTTIPHPNVFEGWHTEDKYPYICLDMLKEASSSEPYQGWTSAYSVSSIL